MNSGTADGARAIVDGGKKTREQRIVNPVLRGFHPDPCLLRTEDGWWIATSTFQWFPGVALYHSIDLVDWTAVRPALERTSQLDLVGIAGSDGIYAPQISCRNGLYYLVYTVVAANTWPLIDSSNYLVVADRLEGPWSEPVFLHARGFDPSLFHDVDGRSYLVSNEIDPRPGVRRSSGIVLQEFDAEARRLVGPVVQLTDRDAEGPHLYRRDGWIYLVVAEGGTSWSHRAEVLRARDVTGPYEASPYGPLATSVGDPGGVLQKAGHASLAPIDDDRWLLACLVSRPNPHRCCPLGRETALATIRWTPDGWPVAESGLNLPSICRIGGVSFPSAPSPPCRRAPAWCSLREPLESDWIEFGTDGEVVLRGRQSPFSRREQSLVGVRMTELDVVYEVELDFQPDDYRQLAGLAAYYDERAFAWLRVTANGPGGARSVGLMVGDLLGGGERCDYGEDQPIPDLGPIRLRWTVGAESMRAAWRTPGGRWHEVGSPVPTDLVSDDYAGRYGFTGAFAALIAVDLAQRTSRATFRGFRCTPAPSALTDVEERPGAAGLSREP